MKILINNGTTVISKSVENTTEYSELEQMLVQQGYEEGTFVVTNNGEELCETMTLEENGVECGDMLNLALVVDGGKKKKKKKVFKTAKKNKHKHVNTKLKILTYYTINDDNTVTRAKLESPYAPPGRVTYLARHGNDRHYCGRAHVALKIEDDN